MKKKNKIFIIIIAIFAIATLLIKHSLQVENMSKRYSPPTTTLSETDLQASLSSTHRIKIITYTVVKNDTLTSLATKFDISTQTIKWANNLTSDTPLTAGQELQILPITGIIHKVVKGDTLSSVAKKYQADPQAIADFYSNKFVNPETLELIDGSIMIIPNGIPDK